MLYDPKWEIQTRPDVFSLEGLVAWLEKQPGNLPYDYIDSSACLLCQYFAASGLSNPSVVLNFVSEDGAPDIEFPDVLHEVAIGQDLAGVWTFGAALERARAANSAGK